MYEDVIVYANHILQMVDICEALILHELGGLVGHSKNFSLAEAYYHSDSATPVIFILPNVVCGESAEEQQEQQQYIHPGRSMTNCCFWCQWRW